MNDIDRIFELGYGPGIIGAHPNDIQTIRDDPATLMAEMDSGELVPYAAPMGRHFPWYNPSFFEENLGISPDNCYAWTGQRHERIRLAGGQENVLANIGLVAVDYYAQGASNDLKLLRDISARIGHDFQSVELRPSSNDKTMDGAPFVDHYSALLEPTHNTWDDLIKKATGKVKGSARPSGLEIIAGSISDGLYDDIWAFYGPILQSMTSEHPITGDLSKDELRHIMEAPGSLNFFTRDTDGVANAFATFSDKPSNFDWLDQVHLEKRAREHPIIYSVVVAARRGIPNLKDAPMGVTLSISTGLGQEVSTLSGPVELIWECPEASTKTVPGIVAAIGRATNIKQVTPQRDYQIRYRALIASVR